MKLQQRGEERMTAPPDVVWPFVTDPAKVASCLPEVVDVTVHDDTHFDATVGVNVGPVRGRFKLKFELLPDPAARSIVLKIAGGGFGSAVDLSASANITDSGDGGTVMPWTGEAEVRGPVAAVGGRVLEAQAKKLIAQTFANVGERVSNPAAAVPPPGR